MNDYSKCQVVQPVFHMALIEFCWHLVRPNPKGSQYPGDYWELRAMSIARHHAEWLSLVETSGPSCPCPSSCGCFRRVWLSAIRRAKELPKLREAYARIGLERGEQSRRPPLAGFGICSSEKCSGYPPKFLPRARPSRLAWKATCRLSGETLRPASSCCTHHRERCHKSRFSDRAFARPIRTSKSPSPASSGKRRRAIA